MSVMVGFVGASLTGVSFNTPIANQNVSGTFNVSWDNNNSYPDLDLQYSVGDCNTLTWVSIINDFNETVKSYLWETSVRTDGTYCLRIWEGINNESISGNFTIDNTAPNITFDNTPYSAILNQPIFINATLIDGVYVKNYTIDFGDTNTTNADVNSSAGSVNQSHVYNTTGSFTVTLTVRDNAGNSAISTKIVTVNAVAPDWVIELSANSKNLISIPFVPNDTSYYSSGSNTHYKNVLGGIRSDLDRVWGYTFDTSTNTNSWKYRKTTSTSWSTTGSLDEIVPGYGYILFMDNNSTLYGHAQTISNVADSAPVIPSSVKLANGYNLIGVFGSGTPTIDTALSSLKSLANESYWHKLYYVNGTEKTGSLAYRKGYWISMKHLPDTATEDYYTYYP